MACIRDGCVRLVFRSWDQFLENFRTFLGHSHYYGGIDELSEATFMERYGEHLSDKIKKFLEEKDTSFFTYKQELHFSYS